MAVRTYPIDIKGMKRDLPICPINEDLYIAGFVIVGDTELSEHCAKELLKLVPKYDYILTAETKGIPLAHDMARLTGQKKFLVARKGLKAYMVNPISASVESITTKGQQHLYLDENDALCIKNHRILVVDDVVSTGRSLEALELLVNKCGGEIAGRMTILAEGEAAARNDITYLQKLPLFNKEGKPLPFN